ncbi:succinyl-CoA--3-ketoacid-CoA transferase [Subtercola boreus]|uniref:Succinyl-CoA--3-ketoacid-CoA transferase n=1 Tax=Subtercola boreus TaxID=120213 RepID=A0A3E0VAW1_9MICO|nr:CoA transferase subunit A [Subtercola boreus]RFA06996.1 succinyl-CoA--3-ketoacid-CoA transferase [Subtercola boreus]
MDKVSSSAADAVADIGTGASLAVGGFGWCGVPTVLIEAIRDAGATDLEVVSNNCGADGWGLAILLAERRISRVVASFFGDNREFARQYLQGELEVEITPQGTLAERLRAAGAGIPGFFTPTGVGTLVEQGGLVWRFDHEGNAAVVSPAKPVRTFVRAGKAQQFLLEEALPTDFAIVRAALGDRHGNLVFHASAKNFNPLAAMAGRITIAEVERLVEPGEIDPDLVHLPGIFVDRIVELTPEQVAAKQIEKRMVKGMVKR